LSADLCPAERFASASNHEFQPGNGKVASRTSSIPDAENAGNCAEGSRTPACLSSWSSSPTKRIFDCACVLVALPLLMPVLLLVALAVRVTSRGPVLFLQKRVGRSGRPFTIVKFRTLDVGQGSDGSELRFTSIGRLLRRWKLDELPQIFNVLAGEMSLVGPRPKMREYELGNPPCRPGITGAASLVFACEEELLERVPNLGWADAYRAVVMPAKFSLDAEYMARATFLTDLKLIAGTALRRWDTRTLHAVIGAMDSELWGTEATTRGSGQLPRTRLAGPSLPRLGRMASAEEGSVV
jgi:lipopolysaccharide/colanic/teichoic acid biosynthesis glycosyltransferase